MTFLGGGFGRKSKPDFVVEAALLAQAAGAPVRVQWTREDDVRHGYYHAVSTQRLDAGLDARAEARRLAPPHRLARRSARRSTSKADRPATGQLQQGVIDLPLAVPNVRVESCEAPAHVRIGWLRSVYNINHAFAVQSFIGELAAATGRDPKDSAARARSARPGPAHGAGGRHERSSNYGAPSTSTRSTSAACAT